MMDLLDFVLDRMFFLWREIRKNTEQKSTTEKRTNEEQEKKSKKEYN